MGTKVAFVVGGLILAFVLFSARKPKLEFFSPVEFGIWWPMMNNDLLVKLDEFRRRWGAPVEISNAQGALGRHGGESKSQHNVDRYGRVNAVDVFPKVDDGSGGYRYIQTALERQRAYQIAQDVGFTGIGLYTDTVPGNMLHLDVRSTEQVATWSRINDEYFGINSVLS